MINLQALLAAAVLSGVFGATVTRAEDFVRDQYGVTVQRDVTYAQGIVDASSRNPRLRDLKLDIYRPVADGKELEGRPAVILAYGGAFHRGSKGTTTFEEDGASDSPMGEYCQMLAASGYVCLSIDYRLMPDDPALPEGLDATRLVPKAMVNPAATARVDIVRQRMGLPVLDATTREQLWNTMHAASQDMSSAVTFAKENAEGLGIDPDRIAIGGFSAGAVAAIDTAYGRAVPVQAVVLLSGVIGGFNPTRSVEPGMPPALLLVGQNDLEGVQMSSRALLPIFAAAGIEAESAWVPGFGHFYPMGAPSLGDDLSKLTIKARVLRFLGEHLGMDKEK